MHAPTVAEFPIPRHSDAGFLARTLVEQHLRPHLSENATGHVKMVVSELVDNAVAHGQGRVVLRTEVHEDSVRIEIIGESGAGPQSLGGWALRIVDALAARWGVHAGSTLVWADVPRR